MSHSRTQVGVECTPGVLFLYLICDKNRRILTSRHAISLFNPPPLMLKLLLHNGNTKLVLVPVLMLEITYASPTSSPICQPSRHFLGPAQRSASREAARQTRLARAQASLSQVPIQI